MTQIDEAKKLIAEMFTRHHADACYPTCYDFEADSFGQAILTALAEEGYVIVPREPTEAMHEHMANKTSLNRTRVRLAWEYFLEGAMISKAEQGEG